jgi:AraC family transcriptional regulator
MRGILVEVPPETASELLLDESPHCFSQMAPRSGLEDAFLVETALALQQELRGGNPRGTLYTDALAAAFASHLLLSYTTLPQRAARRARRMSPSRLRQVLDFVCSNLSDDISLAQLARVAGLSPFHFSHAFRWNTGVSPYRFVRNVRREPLRQRISEGAGHDARPMSAFGLRASRGLTVLRPCVPRGGGRRA